MRARRQCSSCRGLSRRTLVLVWLLALCAVVLSDIRGVAAKQIPLSRQADDVAGRFNEISIADGPKGESVLNNPLSMCESYNNDPNLLLIGQLGTFRTFNVSSQYTGTWDADYPHTSNPVICSCATVRGSVTAVFYVTCATVQGENNAMYRLTATNGSVYKFDDPQMGIPIAVTTRLGVTTGSELYVLDNKGRLMRCRLDQAASVTVCNEAAQLALTLPHAQGGLAVSDKYIFVATTEKLLRFSLEGDQPRQPLPGLPGNRKFINVRYTSRPTLPPQLIAMTTNDFFLITANDTGMYAQSILGTTSDECVNAPISAISATPFFCDLNNFYAITPDTIYGIMSARGVVRELFLPPVQIALPLAPPPFPVGMDNASATLPTIYQSIDDSLATLLRPPSGADWPQVNRSTVAVQPYPWPTTMELLIPQRLYDDETTEAAIRALLFTEATGLVAAYYDKSNLALYGDTNIFPLCNRTKMNTIEPQTANFARNALQYPLIYTDPLETVTLNGNPNITRVKLLLPWSFDDGVNVTSRTLLEKANYTAFILDTIASTYDNNHKADIVFQGETFNLDALDPSRIFELRWIVRRVVEQQLDYCQSIAGAGSRTNSAEVDSSGSLSCEPTVGITNMTRIPLVSRLYPEYRYTVFIPESYGYNFDLNHCLGLIDWGFLQQWINGNTPPEHKKRCDTGCIVGIAVAAAVAAAVLIILLIILVSKRRRLATVVVPPRLKEPEFASTVDLDDRSDHSNPLQA